MDETYLFIDGKYLTEVHSKAIMQIFPDAPEIHFVQLKAQAGAQRVFYYDCIRDTKDDRESEEQFQARMQKQEEYFQRIRANHGFHLRLGTLTGKRPRLRQKEVDVQLAVDMLTHGLNKNMSKAVLVAGDLDFRPIVEALVRNGVFVEIWYEKNSAAKDLFWAADFGRELTFQDFFSMSDPRFTQANPLPEVQIGGEPPHVLENAVRSGQANGNPVYFYKGLRCKLYAPNWEGRSLTLLSDNSEVLEKYFALFYAPVVWR
jgi:uncharacterized LabA/DUF88 family protein